MMGWLGIGVSSLGIAGPKGQHPLTVGFQAKEGLAPPEMKAARR